MGLGEACKDGDVATIRRTIRNVEDKNAQIEYEETTYITELYIPVGHHTRSETPLDIALIHFQLHAVIVLLANGASLNHADSWASCMRTLVRYYPSEESSNLLKTLILAGANITLLNDHITYTTVKKIRDRLTHEDKGHICNNLTMELQEDFNRIATLPLPVPPLTELCFSIISDSVAGVKPEQLPKSLFNKLPQKCRA